MHQPMHKPVHQTDRLTNLTTSQYRIWRGQKLDPDRPLYNMALAFHIQGELQPKIFKVAFNTLLQRSDALRTVIIEEEGVPRQTVQPAMDHHLKFDDLSHHPDPWDVVQPLLKKWSRQNFELDRKLFESRLVKMADQTYIWYLNQHHLITDGWSCGILYRRMAEFYDLALSDRIEKAPELPSYRDYQLYERDFKKTKNYSNATAYWKTKTQASSLPLDLYGRFPAKTATDSKRFFCDIGQDRSEALRRLALEDDFRSLSLDLSLFNIFSAVLFSFLYRLSGRNELVIGTPSHNRPTTAFKETIGLFIELFPLETRISPKETFRSLIKKVAPAGLDFLKNALPGTSGIKTTSTYSVVLNYINASFSDFCGMPMKSTWIHPDHVDRGHALRLQVQDFDKSGSIQLHFDLDHVVFNDEIRHKAIHHFLRLIDALLNDPDQPIDTVDLLSDDEKSAIHRYNETHVDLSAQRTLLDLIRHHVSATPNTTAVIENGRATTYAELDQRSDLMTRHLQSNGVTPGAVVAVFSERSTDLVCALVGILKAGAAFVPIDAAFPEKRLAYILKDCNASVVITQEHLKHHIPAEMANIIALDGDWEDRSRELPAVPKPKIRGRDPAYIIYTSGSTGLPKGVLIEHHAFVNYLVWANRQYMHDGPHDLPLFSTVAADLTLTSIFLPLISGSKIRVYRESSDGADLSVIDVWREDAVDIIKLTPSHLSMLTDHQIPPKRLKKLIVGGEDFKTGLAQKVSGMFHGQIEIFNEYGPTEATVGCMIHRFDPSADDNSHTVAVGKPIDNMQIYLLDAGLNPVPIGVQGDIYIAGKGLARGYLNQPQLTSRQFMENPFNKGEKMYASGDVGRWKTEGVMEFLGRRDHQVKVKGFRIELGEIESGLVQFPSIKESLVRVVDQHAGSETQGAKECRKCGLSSKHPQAKLDGDGICRICRNFEKQKEKAGHYFKTEEELRRILEHAKQTTSGPHDCIMQYSGGKDSTYALYKLVEMGMRPLVFSFDNGFISNGAKENIRRVVEDLDLELVWGETPKMNDIFVDSLRRFSNVCNGCQKVVNTLSVNLAKERGIRYIITGLSRGQFFETRVSQLFFDRIFDSETIDQKIIEARKAYHRMPDAVSKHLDVSAFQDDAVFEEIKFVDFYRYTDVELHDLLEFLDKQAPWVRPSDTGRSTNCKINEAGIYVHKKERGYHNYALPYSWDVRLGHKDRASSLEELDDDIDETRVKRILDTIGYDPEEKTFVASNRRIVSYYVSDEKIPPDELRRFLSKTLPAYMMPAHFIKLDAFPLNATGKIDRKALPLPDDSRTGLSVEYIPPRDDVESLLSGIWAKVMGTELVGIKDNFFDLGGDSILGIRVVAQAAQKGVELTPAMLFEYPTVADLSFHLKEKKKVSGKQERMDGSIPLTPIQRWFFERRLPQPNIWNMALKLDLLADIDPAAMKTAFLHLVDHHDALRLRFNKGEVDWLQNLTEDSQSSFRLETYDMSQKSPKEQQASIENAMAEAQISLDLQTGPIFKVLLFRTGGLGEYLMGIVIHHLAVDGISWYILLEDLESVYRQIKAGETPTIDHKTTSFRQWSNAIHKYADSDAAVTEADHWKTMGDLTSPSLPLDAGLPGNGLESSAKTHVAKLDRTYDQDQLQKAAKTGRVSVEELLLGALMPALCKWMGSNSVRLDKEGHGREGVIENTPLYHTVGWFTSLYPLNLTLPRQLTNEQLIKAVKKESRAIPNRGFGYGPLYYLNSDPNIADALSKIPKAQVLFNYLGTLGQMTGQSSLFRLNGPLQGFRDPKAIRPYLLEINSFIIDGQLEMHWTFDEQRHQRQTIEKVSADALHHLGKLIDHCLQLPKKETDSKKVAPTRPVELSSIEDDRIESAYPLSPVQQGMLFHTLKNPETGVYVEQYCCTLSGRLNHDHFKSAWQAVVQENPVMRTAFQWDSPSGPIQKVYRNVDLDWDVKDLTAKTNGKASQWLEDYLAKDRQKGFALDKAPSMRFRLFRLDENKYRWVWSFHHLLLDGWSTPMVIRKVLEHYHHICQGRVLEKRPVQPYRKFIDWLGRQDLSLAEKFWKERLKGYDDPTPLSISHYRKERTGYDQKELTLPHQTTHALTSAAKRHRLTLNTVIQGLWAILLHRYNDKRDIVFGATVSGRPPTLVGVEEMVGLFINTLPVRVIVDPDAPLTDWLAQLMTAQARASAYEYTPLLRVQEWSEIPPGVPLFDNILVFENYPAIPTADGLNPDLRINDIEYREQSNYPLAILVVPGEELRLIAVHDRSLFSESGIGRLLEHLAALIHSFADQPDQPIKALSMMTASDRQRLNQWRGTDEQPLTEQPVHRLFEEQAAQNGAKEAVVYQNRRLTYSEINNRANRLADYLMMHHGAGPGAVYGLYFDRSIEMVTTIMAVLKSGSAYLPLDPTYPEKRIAYMMADAGISVVLTLERLRNHVPSKDHDVMAVDSAEIMSKLDQYRDTDPQTDIRPDQMAYIIYTSGSTGAPKGVMVSHANLTHATGERIRYYQPAPDRFLLLSSISFDSSVAAIFGSLCQGGTLFIPDHKHYRDIEYLAAFTAEHQITHTLAVPSLYHSFLHYHHAEMASLQTVVVAGEPCPRDLVKAHFASLPDTRLYNEYGPTEATVWATVMHCEPAHAAEKISIGRPIANTEVHILDKDLQPVPPGIPGELYLGGGGITLGYLNQPEQTAERFINHPFNDGNGAKLYKTGDIAKFRSDGNLMFMGRNDGQVKIRGYRIETGEIESALMSYQAVQQAVVVPTIGHPSSKTKDASFEQDPEALAKQLAALGKEAAEEILSGIENQNGDGLHDITAGNPTMDQHRWRAQTPQFEVDLRIRSHDFIRPPRTKQRKLLVRQAMEEFKSDLAHLDKVSKHFVAGRTTDLEAFDISHSALDNDRIMEDWQIPIMKAMARQACEAGGDLLEIGFGRGVSSDFIQTIGIRSHTIIESNESIIDQHFRPWQKKYHGRNIRLVHGRWQDVMDQLDQYDAVFFHAFPLNEEEFAEYVLNSITFAEHFFPTAAQVLRPGGVFTYLSTEIDSLSRRHQRALFQHFSSIAINVQPLSVPDNTIDTWWADTMVIVKAIK